MVKKIIGIVLIALGCILEIAVVWALIIGANLLGAFVILVVGILLILLGKTLVKNSQSSD